MQNKEEFILLFVEIKFYCETLAVLKETMKTRLTLNSQRCPYPSLLSHGSKSIHHHIRLSLHAFKNVLKILCVCVYLCICESVCICVCMHM